MPYSVTMYGDCERGPVTMLPTSRVGTTLECISPVFLSVYVEDMHTKALPPRDMYAPVVKSS